EKKLKAEVSEVRAEPRGRRDASRVRLVRLRTATRERDALAKRLGDLEARLESGWPVTRRPVRPRVVSWRHGAAMRLWAPGGPASGVRGSVGGPSGGGAYPVVRGAGCDCGVEGDVAASPPPRSVSALSKLSHLGRGATGRTTSSGASSLQLSRPAVTPCRRAG